jgi:hypothetical protein
MSVAMIFALTGRQNLRILLHDLLVVEVDHIDLEREGHRTAVLLVAEALQDSRLELDRQPVACLQAVCAQCHQFMLLWNKRGMEGQGGAVWT